MVAETFPPDPAAVGTARRFVAGCLPQVGDQLLERILVMVSELASNCLRHAASAFRVELAWSDEAVRVAVVDWGAGTPTLRSPTPSEPSGRGLRIVEALADEWGIDAQGGGKAVWFQVALERPTARR